MILYLPERIYNKIKDNSQYKSIEAKMEVLYSECKTIEDYVKISKDSSSTVAQVYADLTGFIKTTFSESNPEFVEEYIINNGEYLKQDMITKLYSSDKLYDYENKFYLLSNIINQSYSDNQFTMYLTSYIQLFESLTDKDTINLSKYIWLKYMYAKIYMTAYNNSITEDNYEDLCKQFSDFYNKIATKVNDYDITLNYALEAINDSIHAALSKDAKCELIMKFIGYFESTLLTENFQYKDCSLSYLNLLDNKNMIYIQLEQFTSVYHNTSIICSYISNALNNLANTLRGLGYYDKCNQNLFGLQIRKYLRLLNEVPLLSDLKIENLSDKDKEYVQSDRIGNKVSAANPNKITDIHTLEDIDLWFKDNQGLEDLKKIIMEG